MIVSAALTLTSVALAIHIAAVVIAFGPLFVYPTLGLAVRRSDPDAVQPLYRAQYRVARRMITPALPATLLTGIYLAIREHDLGKAWVIVPMALIVVLMALHRLVFLSGYRRLADRARDEPDPTMARQSLELTITRSERAAALLVLIAIFFMTVKPLG